MSANVVGEAQLFGLNKSRTTHHAQDTAYTQQVRAVEEGYCPNGCGTIRFKRKRFGLGTKVVHEVCPTCLGKELKSNNENISADVATQQIDLLLESYQELSGEISGRSRELSRLQNELSYLKEEIRENKSTRNMDTTDFEERLQQAMLVIEDKVEFMIAQGRNTEPSTLEQIRELRANMVQLEDKVRKTTETKAVGTTASGYALVDVLSQLEQVKIKAQKDESFLKQENQEVREEIEELQVDLRVVQRTMENVPGLMSDLSGDVNLLNKSFSFLRTEMEKRHAEYMAKFKAQEKINELQASWNRDQLTRNASFMEQINELKSQIEDLKKGSAARHATEQVAAMQQQLDQLTANTVTAEAVPTTRLEAQQSLADIRTQVTALRIANVVCEPMTESNTMPSISEQPPVPSPSVRPTPNVIRRNEASPRPAPTQQTVVMSAQPTGPSAQALPVATGFEVQPNFKTQVGSSQAATNAQIAQPVSYTISDVRSYMEGLVMPADVVQPEKPDVSTRETVCSVPEPKPKSGDAMDIKSLENLYQANSVTSILDIMSKHPSEDVQALGTHKLGMMTMPDADNKVRNASDFLNAGGTYVVIEGMEGYAESSEVATNGLFLLHNITLCLPDSRGSIVDAGCIKVVMNILQGEHAMHVTAQHYGLFLLGSLAPAGSQKDREMIINKGGVYLVLDGLRAHPLVADIQTYCLTALCSLMGTDKEMWKSVAYVGAIDLVLWALNEHTSVDGIQRKGLLALSMLARSSEENRSAIIEREGIKTAMASIRENSVAGIQENGLLALECLCTDDEAAWAEVISQGGIALVVSILEMQPFSAGVQEHGLLGLYRMADLNADIKAAIGAAGIEVALTALRVHSKDPSVQQHALGVLSSSANENAETKSLIVTSKGIELTTNALKSYPEMSGVQLNGLRTLVNLAAADTSNIRSAIVNAGGLSLTLAALKVHVQVPEVVEYGLIAVGKLATAGNMKSWRRLVREGGIDVILQCLRTHPEVSEINQWGLYALANVAAAGNETAWEMIVKADGISVVLESLKRHQNASGVVHCGCYALGNLAAASAKNSELIVKNGGIKLVLKALKAHPNVPGVQQYGLYTLANLTGKMVEEKPAYASRGIDLAVHALQKYTNFEEIQQYALNVLVNLKVEGSSHMIDLVLEGMRLFPEKREIQMWGCRAIVHFCEASSNARGILKSKGAVEVVKQASRSHPEAADEAMSELSKRGSLRDWRKSI